MFVVALAVFAIVGPRSTRLPDPLLVVLAAVTVAGVAFAARGFLPADPAAALVAAATLLVALPTGLGAAAPWALGFALRKKWAPAAVLAVVALLPIADLVRRGDFAFALPSNAVVVGAGVLGAAFGAMTGLPRAVTVLVAIMLGFVDPDALLALAAVSVAVLPAAVVRTLKPERRDLVALAAGLPIVVAALAGTLG